MRTNKPCKTSNANRGENLHEPFFGGVLFYLFLDPKTPNTSIGFWFCNVVQSCKVKTEVADASSSSGAVHPWTKEVTNEGGTKEFLPMEEGTKDTKKI